MYYHLATLAGVGIHDGLGMFVEGVKTLLDGLDVVVDASGRLTALEQTLGHGVVADFKVEDFRAGTDFLFKLFALNLGFVTLNIIDFSVIMLPEPLREGSRRSRSP